MHWKQVCLVAQTFAAAKRCSYSARYPIVTVYDDAAASALDRPVLPTQRLTIVPSLVKPSAAPQESWLVRLPPTPGRRAVYFPPVCDPGALRLTLEKAWVANGGGEGNRIHRFSRSGEVDSHASHSSQLT